MRSVLFRRGVQLGVISFIAFGAVGCTPKMQNDLERIWDALVVKIAGKPGEPPVRPTEQKAAEEESVYSTGIAKRAQANAEVLREIFLVTYMREPRDRAEFGSLVDTLNQGASFEGIHNGLSHSSEYRKLEISNPGASPDALRTFGRELALLELELPEPTKFRRSAASPLPYPVQPGMPEEESGSPDELRFDDPSAPAAHPVSDAGHDAEKTGRAAAPSGEKPTVDQLADEYSRVFVGASIFTLKRVICDEAIKVMNVKNEYKENLALWYSKTVARMAGYKVDFGLQQRNLADESFHYAWAIKTDADRVKWEVLNRYHRLLNEANRIKQ